MIRVILDHNFVRTIVTGDAPVNYWPISFPVHRNSPVSLWLSWLVPVPFSILKWHLEFNSKWYTLINPLHRDDSPEHSIPSPTNPGLQTHRRPPNTSSTHWPLGWHFWGHFSLPTKEVNHDYSWDQLHKAIVMQLEIFSHQRALSLVTSRSHNI